MALGIAFAAGIILFMGAGYGLDRWLGTMPIGTVAGTLVGGVLGFLSVYRRVIGKSGRSGGSGGSGRSGGSGTSG